MLNHFVKYTKVCVHVYVVLGVHRYSLYFSLLAIVDGDSLQDVYAKVKNVIHEQSGNHMWVPSSENI